MASYPTHQDPEYIRIWKTDTPAYMTSSLNITPRTLLPWLLARFQCVNTGSSPALLSAFWEGLGTRRQAVKDWEWGYTTSRTNLFPLSVTSFLQLQCHVRSCDIIEVMWCHVMSCDYNVMSWWQCVQFAKSLWPKSSSVECLPSGEIPLFSWPWNAGRKETWTPEPDTIDTTSSSTPPSLSPLPQIISVWFEEFRVCKLTPNMWWNSQNLTSRNKVSS